MAQEYLTVLGALLGTVTGFFLNEFKNRQDKRNQIKSVRMLIRFEIDKNLEMLSELWIKITKINENDVVNYAYKLAESNLPPFTKESWRSQLSFLPMALNEEDINNVDSFYKDIENIKSIYLSLSNLAEQDEKDRRVITRKYGNFVPAGSNVAWPMAFKNGAPALWKDFERITHRLLENSNPLNKVEEPHKLKED